MISEKRVYRFILKLVFPDILGKDQFTFLILQSEVHSVC